ncbi:Holliday junction resolvase RuvX [Thermocrinis minervae]|uniref:Putative pre-16S rRNA nuclease n=1 Tax=Thermocrinis minervae TaxID=381751 RepID=A0A1M6QY61_9AQUI|nr:Holliday junction resolvase RuvX [Thermocrinis minervae]SHK25018.1 putative holliday junction resolvase [Thermocrinis minervae]
MKVLALDYGSKKIGVAIGDTELKIASPLTSFKNGEAFFSYFKNLVEQYNVSLVVVGLPLTLRGKEGQRAQEVKEFVRKLREYLKDSVQIVLWDERFTTKEAYSYIAQLPSKKRKEIKDAMAAYVILKEYLGLDG